MLKTHYWPWLVLLLITIIFHSNHPLNSDEGIVLEGAWNLINHKELYIDFFEFVAPGSFYLIFFVWKIFGISYFAAKLISVMLLFLAAIGIYQISQQIKKGWINHLAPTIFILSSFYWPIINANVFNVFFIIWAIYFLLLGLERKQVAKFIIAGLLTSMAIIFLQSKGIIFLLAVILFIVLLAIKQKKAIWLKSGLYYFLASLLPLVLLLIKWPLPLLYDNLVAFPLNHYMGINQLPFYILGFFGALLIILLIKYWKNANAKIWLLLWLQFILLLTTIPRPDFYHISLVVFPIYILLILASQTNKLSSYIRIVLLSVMVFVIILPSLIYLTPPFSSIKYHAVWPEIEKNCQDSPYLYSGPFMPGLYFETRKINPGPFYALFTDFNAEEDFIVTKQALEKHQPTCAILNYGIVAKFQYNQDNPLDNYIQNNYQLIYQDDQTLIYKK